jgi:isoamylase
MLLAGDEFGHTQHGNNNAYCQDSPLAWLDWNLSAEQRTLLDFTREVMRLRKTEPVFRRRHFFQGRPIHGSEIKDLYWLKPDGTEMTDADWNGPHLRCICMVLPGNQIAETGERGEPIVGNSFAILLNAHYEPIPFQLGARRRVLNWRCILDTAASPTQSRTFEHLSSFPLQPRSMVVLQAEFKNSSTRI